MDEPKRAAVDGVLDGVTAVLPRLTSRPELIDRHLPALALARAARLLRGMVALAGEGLSDAGGVLLRPLYETWLVGLYMLYGGSDAVDAVAGAGIRSIRALDRQLFGERVFEEADGWEGPTDKIKWDALTRSVRDLLVREGHGAESLMDMYEVLYRGESLMNVHGGMHSIQGHLVDGGHWLGVAEVRRGSDDGEGHLMVGAALVAVLGQAVFERFGVDHRHLGRQYAELERLTREDAGS